MAATLRCGGNPPKDAVATVDGDPILRQELESYLTLHLLPAQDADATDPRGLDRVKSRLLDTLIDERILRGEAERRGLKTTDAEVDAYLADEMIDVAADDEVARPPEGEPAWRRLAERRLLIVQLEETLAASLPPIEEAEVQEYVERHRDAWAPERRVRLRALRIESRAAAGTAYDDIRSRRLTFDEAVVAHGLTLEQTAPVEVALSQLSDEVRVGLSGLTPGQVSTPIAAAGSTYLFRVESWTEPPPQDEEHWAERARLELDRLRRRWAAEALLEELRQKARVTVYRGQLPFGYLPDR